MVQDYGYTISQIRKEKIRDIHGQECPEEVFGLLQKAGIASFSCRPQGLDWKIVREDAKALLSRIQIA